MPQISTQTKKDVYIHAAIIICSLLVMFLGFFFVYLPASTNHGETVSVPNLKGMTTEQLDDFLSDRDLDYEISDCTFVPNAPKLAVLSQYPAAGAFVKEGRKIYITITSLYAPQIEMPKLTDRSLQSAEQVLRSYGLEVGELKYKPDLAEGIVLEQRYNGQPITPGTRIAKGSKITLIVGDGYGNQEFEVPDLMSKTLEEAQIIASGSDLQLMIMYDETSTEPAGTVIFQNPASGEGNKVKVGQTIDIKIAGPKVEETTPPDDGGNK